MGDRKVVERWDTGSENYSGKRSLRKKEPIIHIFYYKNTQDEIYMNNSLEEFKEYVV